MRGAAPWRRPPHLPCARPGPLATGSGSGGPCWGCCGQPLTRDTRRQLEYAALGLLLAIPGFVFIVAAGHRRVRAVAQFRWHAGRAAVADGGPAGRPAARRGAPPPGQPAAGIAGRAAAPAAPAAWRPGPGPGGPDRSRRLAGLCLPAAQAAALGPRHDHRGLPAALGAPLPDLSDLVGDPARQRRGDPPARVADVVETRPPAGGPVGAFPGRLLRPGSGGPGRAALLPVVAEAVQRRGREAGRQAARAAAGKPGA